MKQMLNLNGIMMQWANTEEAKRANNKKEEVTGMFLPSHIYYLLNTYFDEQSHITYPATNSLRA